ncbi:MAG: sugar phosphate isomerase/epimerase [Lentisphaeria bacterium]|nr:sugar phosphate isomerase/epimerase [Lentisphaeria bacterium]
MKRMEIGVLAMLRKGEDPFSAIGEFGLKTAQLQNWDMDNLNPETAAQVRQNLERSGVRLAAFWGGYTGEIIWNSYGGPGTCGLVPANQRARRIDELKRGADFAKMIGAPALITHCGFIPENPQDPLYGETLEAIREVAQHCKSLDIGFWFETGQETPLTLLRTIEDIGLDNLGVNLDTANLILYGRGNPVDALEVIGKYVRNLHIKDGLFPTDGHSLGKEVPFGEGRADFAKIIRKLYALDFTGELIIEREISGPQQAADIRIAVDKLTAHLEEYGDPNNRQEK